MRRLTAVFSLLAVLVLCPGLGLGQVPDYAERDDHFKFGKIKFTRTESLREPFYISKEEIAFSDDGKLVHRLEDPSGKQLGADIRSIVFVINPKWRYLLDYYKDGKTVVVFYDLSPLPRNTSRMFFLSEKPCFPLASGFSKMKEAKTSIESGKVKVTGKLSDGTTLVATYSSDDLRVPRAFDRTHQGRPYNHWDFSGAIEASPGFWIPKQAVDREGIKSRTFDIESADFGTRPTDAELTVDWFKEGIEVQDRRVDPEVRWTYEELKSAVGDGPMDPLILLKLSEERSQMFRTNENSKRRQEAAMNKQSKGKVVWFFAILGATFVVVYLGLKFFVRKAT